MNVNISCEQSSPSSISMLILLMDFDNPGSADLSNTTSTGTLCVGLRYLVGGALGRFAVVGDGCKCHKCRCNDSSLCRYSSADSMCGSFTIYLSLT